MNHHDRINDIRKTHPQEIDPARKVWVPVKQCGTSKMHLKHDCSCLSKLGVPVDKVYLTQEEARLQFKAINFCRTCRKIKSVKGGTK